MRRTFTCCLLTFMWLCESQAQPELLLLPNSELRESALETERLLDLVNVWVADSILPTEIERHRFPGGFAMPWIGIKWQRIDSVKQKFVGTTVGFGVAKRGILTENDVIFDIASHLPHYQALAFRGYQAQKEIGRAARRVDYNAAPFDSLPTADNWHKYTLHCELTPEKRMRPVLDSLFYPTDKGDSLESHQNFSDGNRQIGLYGAFCSDCNHTCHPEIHPYEWIWWLDLTAPDDEKKWFFGMFKEGSNRFPRWSKGPKLGAIQVPFAVPNTTQSLVVDINLIAEDVSDNYSSPELEVNDLQISILGNHEGKCVVEVKEVQEDNGYTTGYIEIRTLARTTFAGSMTIGLRD